MKPAATAPPAQIAVLRFGHAGDVLLTLPAIAALHAAWPAARLVVLTRPAYVPLLQQQPGVAAALSLAKGSGLCGLQRQLRALAAERDGELAVLDLHGRAYSRLLRLAWLRSRWRCWHKRPWQHTWAVVLGGARASAQRLMVDRYHAAAAALVGRPLPRQPLRFAVPAAAQARADALLHSVGLQQAPVALAPGAMWATKRWPPARFAALARQLLAQGHPVVLTGSAGERPLHAQLCAQVPQLVSLAGQGDLATLAGVLRRSRCLVVGDSGPMHLARAVGTPTVALFGCTDPRQFDLAAHTLLTAQPAPDCAPCTFHGRAACPRGHLRCLRDIEVPTVLAAVQRALAAPGPRAAPWG